MKNKTKQSHRLTKTEWMGDLVDISVVVIKLRPEKSTQA